MELWNSNDHDVFVALWTFLPYKISLGENSFSKLVPGHRSYFESEIDGDSHILMWELGRFAQTEMHTEDDPYFSRKEMSKIDLVASLVVSHQLVVYLVGKKRTHLILISLKHLWHWYFMRLSIKCRVCTAPVMSVLTYHSETWQIWP